MGTSHYQRSKTPLEKSLVYENKNVITIVIINIVYTLSVLQLINVKWFILYGKQLQTCSTDGLYMCRNDQKLEKRHAVTFYRTPFIFKLSTFLQSFFKFAHCDSCWIISSNMQRSFNYVNDKSSSKKDTTCQYDGIAAVMTHLQTSVRLFFLLRELYKKAIYLFIYLKFF